MKKFNIMVCDDMGEVVYSKTVRCSSLKEAEDKAFKWSAQVEAEESWFTTWMAKEA